MALTRRTQLVTFPEATPGTEITTWAAADIQEVEDVSFDQSRELLDRAPTGQGLANPRKGVGPGQGSISFAMHLRGGNGTQLPDFDQLLQACAMRGPSNVNAHTLTWGVAITGGVWPGDVLYQAASGQWGIAITTGVSGTSTTVDVITIGAVAASPWDTSGVVNRTRSDDALGNLSSDAVTAATDSAFLPAYQHEMTFTTTGNWSAGDPTAGTSITFSSGGVVTAGAIVVAVSTTTTTCEMLWGTIAADDAVTDSSSPANTATVDNPSGAAQTVWPWTTLRQNRHGLARSIYGALGTFTISGEAGSAAMINFEFTGKKGTHDDAAFVQATTRNDVLGMRILLSGTSSFQVNNIAIALMSFEIAMNNDIALVPSGNQDEGTWLTQSAGRNPTVTVTFSQLSVTDWNWDTDWENGTTVTIYFRIESGTDNNMIFVAPAAQIASVSDGDDNGTATTSITFELRRTIDNDEFGLIFF